MFQNNHEEKSHKKKLSIYVGIFVICLLLGISYALFSLILTGKKDYNLESRGLKLYLDETGESITIENAIPLVDADGMKNTPYKFSLKNGENQDLDYTIFLREDAYENKTPSSTIRYHYTRDIGNIERTRNVVEQTDENGSYYLETGIIPKSTTYNYTFQMWIDYNAGNEIRNTEYSVHLEVLGKQALSIYQEDILHGTDPVLSDNLVPVTIANDGTVKKANIYREWYNYTNKEWANAVVLEDGARDYQAGDTIAEEDIESYFVWIPRYSYQLWDLGEYSYDEESIKASSVDPSKVHSIPIRFGTSNTSDKNTGECTTPMESGTSGNCQVGDYMTHPAFLAFDTNGLWVGKFEPGYRGATTAAEARVSTADSTKLIIKPNSYSWRYMNVGNMFKTSYEYLRDGESHMMKNTEWGAVAYLSHSQYGVNREVYINNSGALTGCGGDTADADGSTSCFNAYGSKLDGIYNQSTTGNISGVFDMSGGSYEYVMGYNTNASSIGGKSEITSLYSDFFTNNEWNKYYDKYTSSSTSAYNNRILGDATGEMGSFYLAEVYCSSWYGDSAAFVHFFGPWFHRGGDYSKASITGVFDFANDNGISFSTTSFRVVLAL